jgi:hypothetical protein
MELLFDIEHGWENERIMNNGSYWKHDEEAENLDWPG